MTVRANAGASWSSDSRRFAFAAIEPGHNVRVYMEDIRERKPRPVTPDLQVPMFAVAGDGAIAVVPAGADRIHLLGQDGTDRGEVRGALSGEVPIRFAADGRLLVRSALQNGPMSVYAVNLASGQRTLWKKLGPEDRAGVSQQPSSGLVVTPDLKYYAYTYGALISQLFVARNLR